MPPTTAFLKSRTIDSVEYGTTLFLLGANPDKREVVIPLPMADSSVLESYNPALGMMSDLLEFHEVSPLLMIFTGYTFRFEIDHARCKSPQGDPGDVIDTVMEVVGEVCTIKERHEPVHSFVSTWDKD